MLRDQSNIGGLTHRITEKEENRSVKYGDMGKLKFISGFSVSRDGSEKLKDAVGGIKETGEIERDKENENNKKRKMIRKASKRSAIMRTNSFFGRKFE